MFDYLNIHSHSKTKRDCCQEVVNTMQSLKTDYYHLVFIFIICSWSMPNSIIPVMVRCGIFLFMIILVSWHQSFIEYGEKMNISWEANYSEFEKQNIFILLSIYQLHLYFVANKSIIEYGEKMSISCETNYSWFENKTW